MNFPCQCCDETVPGDQLKRVPGKVRLGKVMMEQYVCGCCHDEHCNEMKNFWAGAYYRADKCGKCGCHFGSEGVHYAQHQPLETGQWSVLPLCAGCFTAFHTCCANMMDK